MINKINNNKYGEAERERDRGRRRTGLGRTVGAEIEDEEAEESEERYEVDELVRLDRRR